MRAALLVLGFLALVSWRPAVGAIPAPAAAPRGAGQFEQWRRADRDGDGALSRVEAVRMRRLAVRFDAIDRDGDGRLTADEVRAWRKASAQARRAPKRRAVDEFLRLADADGDGLLSLAEALQRLPRLAGKFTRIDADASGALSREEIDAWFALRRASRRRVQRPRPAREAS